MNFTQQEEREAQRLIADASKALRLLLSSSSDKVRFDSARGVWLVHGQLITAVTIRKLLAQIEREGGRRAREHTESFLAQRITLAEWQSRMSDTITAAHWIAAALALGGLRQSSSDRALEEDIASQRRFLSNFAADVKRGQVSETRMKSRAASYMLAVAMTFWKSDLNNKRTLALQAQSGRTDIREEERNPILRLLGIGRRYTQARRTRRASESCVDCVAAAGYWLPIAEMPAIGSLRCGSRCKCYIEYR